MWEISFKHMIYSYITIRISLLYIKGDMNDDHDQITLGRFMIKNKTSSIQQKTLSHFTLGISKGCFLFQKGQTDFLIPTSHIPVIANQC